jgi:hypothetical protein
MKSVATDKKTIESLSLLNGRFWRMLLKRSFQADERNFSGPPMRSACGDVRDRIVLHKGDHGPSYRA